MTSVAYRAVVNPISGGGKGALALPGIMDVLYSHDPDAVAESQKIADEGERRAAILKSTRGATHIFAGGGDGTVTKAIEVTMQSDAGPWIESPEQAQQIVDTYRAPTELDGYVGVGLGSAQDIKAVVGFPTPKKLGGFLELPPEKRETFQMGALWMVHKDKDEREVASLAMHNVTSGVIARVFQLYDEMLERYRARPGKEETPLPVHRREVTGRFLQGFRAGLEAFFKPGITYSVHKKGSPETFFPSTAGFAVFPIPIAGAVAGMPGVYPIAGDDYQLLGVVLTPAEILFITSELIARGGLAKLTGWSGLIGPGARNFSFSFIRGIREFLGLRNDRIFTLTHGDVVRVKMYHQGERYNPQVSDRGLDEVAVPVCLNGDNLSVPLHEFTLIVGSKDQTIPMVGRSDSLLGKMKKRVDALNAVLEQKTAVEDEIRKRYSSPRDFSMRVRLMNIIYKMSVKKWQKLVNSLGAQSTDKRFAGLALDRILSTL